MRLSFRTTLLLLLTSVLMVASVPAWFLLDRRLAADLEGRAQADLERAPMILKDRNQARADALMMHAAELARVEGLGDALARLDPSAAMRLLADGPSFPGEQPLLVAASGEVLVGADADLSGLLALTREGEMPVAFVTASDGEHAVALAPVRAGSEFAGAVGVSRAMDEAAAEALAGLTRSDVVIADPGGGVTATTMDSTFSAVLVALVPEVSDEVTPVELPDGERHWVAAAPLGEGSRVYFVRGRSAELAVLPEMRRGALVAGFLALLLALIAGAGLAGRLSRPVEGLAGAAGRVAEGDFTAELPSSRISEIERVSDSFARMRDALVARLDELSQANRELEDRQERLSALQSELIQRDRLAASNRLVAELAHEIRNPVANVRNCLEVVLRQLPDEGDAREFVEMAIDELLRMHELAERMLDLNRPEDSDGASCDAGSVVARTAELYRAGSESGRLSGWTLEVDADGELGVRMSADALKQILVNLLENAREAMPEGGEIRVHCRRVGPVVTIEVRDRGPGIDPSAQPHLFDPFFTTKDDVRGVGLGLYVAQGIAGRYRGRIVAENRADGAGACFRVVLEAATVEEHVA